MKKITIGEFIKVMDFDIRQNKTCIEINFCIDNSKRYTSCWVGKLISERNDVIYWLGLTEDGTKAYGFTTKIQLFEAKVFDGKSLEDIWELISIISIDACEVEDRISYYMDIN